ncbi:hypothetical protein TNCV_4241071 [Trichonephila clavipes]|nr:hypothetical protein TNCV_4241071 [Trichonephila clavipes]
MPQNLLEHVSASYLLLRLVGYQSSWRSTEDFSTRGLTSLKVALLSFLAPTAWRLTGSAIWRRGSVTTYWGIGPRGTWRKTARRVWSAYFFFSANVVEVPSAVSRVVKDSLSLSAVAHYMSGRPQWKQTGLLSAVLHTSVFLGSGLGIGVKDSCVWLTSRWTSSRTIVRIREAKISLIRQGCNRYDVWKPFKSRSTNSLLLHIFDIVAPFDKTCCVVDFSRQQGPDKYPQQHLS